MVDIVITEEDDHCDVFTCLFFISAQEQL